MEVKGIMLGGQEIDLATHYRIINPATEEPIASVSDAGYAEAIHAIDLAEKAFDGWRKTPPAARADILLKAYQKIREERTSIAKIITLENGKPLKEAEQEVLFSSEYLRWFAEESRRSFGITVPTPAWGRRFYSTMEPVGVVGAIVPWNFPANMITRKCAPALAAGCPVVLKPAPETPLTSLYIAKLLHEVGLPAGVLSVLPSNQAPEISRAFFDHPAIRMVSFTGSTAVGKLLMAKAAERVIRVGLELGGNAPAIVFDDANLDVAIKEIIAIKFLRVGGESCICSNRIYVQKTIYEEFRNRLWKAIQNLRMGNGLLSDIQLGPLINLKAKQKVESLIADAKEKGASVMQAPISEIRGFFVPPTLIDNATEQMRVANEEIFGPIAALYPFTSEEEVIQRANHTPYGLAGYFFTENLSKAIRVGEALQVGFVGINDGNGYVHEIPMGGVKQSGIGREGGQEGLREYLEIKSWAIGINEKA